MIIRTAKALNAGYSVSALSSNINPQISTDIPAMIDFISTSLFDLSLYGSSQYWSLKTDINKISESMILYDIDTTDSILLIPMINTFLSVLINSQ